MSTRFEIANIDRADAIVRRLKKELPGHGFEAKKSDCMALVAGMFGYRNWNDLLAQCGRREQSPLDEFASPEVVRARRALQVETLVAFGVSPAHAAAIVDEIRPTAGGRLGAA